MIHQSPPLLVKLLERLKWQSVTNTSWLPHWKGLVQGCLWGYAKKPTKNKKPTTTKTPCIASQFATQIWDCYLVVNYLILVTSYSCFSPYYELVCWEIYLLYLPVLAVRTLERFLRFVDSKVALQVGFASEFLGADRALEQDFSRHVNHLDVHFQNVLVLRKQHTNLSEHFQYVLVLHKQHTNLSEHFQYVLVLRKQHTNLSFSVCTGPTQTTHKSLIFSMYWSYANNTQISLSIFSMYWSYTNNTQISHFQNVLVLRKQHTNLSEHFQYVLVLHKQHTNLSFSVCTGPTQTTHKSLIFSMYWSYANNTQISLSIFSMYWSYTNNTQISHFQNVLVLRKQHTNLSEHFQNVLVLHKQHTNLSEHFQYALVLHKQHTNLSFSVCTGPTQTTHKSLIFSMYWSYTNNTQISLRSSCGYNY